ncbi:MAG TPA: arginine--tRNA ligase [Dehalococcoidia bacterium]|nr:arginine--tRNA ligase [Dehalococcoidia bacterium]
MLKDRLSDLITRAAEEAQKSGKLPDVPLPEANMERPQNPEHGDYASSLPLKLARSMKMNPLNIARQMVDFIPETAEVESISVAPPGFINITLKDSWVARQVETILESGESFGDIDLGKNSRIQIEFVSINPTGPLHVGHGRGAILGSTLSNIFDIAGYYVEKEYFFNDAGSQMNAFRNSLYARYQQILGVEVEMPSEGYFGNYLIDLAREIETEEGRRFLDMPEDEGIENLGEVGLNKILVRMREDLELLRVDFDVWFSEQSLYKNGQFDTIMEMLRKDGHIGEKEGATWFISTALGEDKDNVVVRSDGYPTYFAADIAYHYNKFIERKFDRVIDIWGADHQGQVPRLKAAVGALGIDPDRLDLLIHQMVTVRRGGELVRISKRSGDLITLREVIDEVGTDACRYFFLSRSANSQMDFDLELAKKESQDNPVYYIQYAHARIASILRLAAERGITYGEGDVSLLTTEPELTLVRKLLLLPELIETVCLTLEPHHLTYYAQDLATSFHSFYKQCRVISKSKTLTPARLKLVEATKTVLARTLHLMGMTAPEKM